PEHFDHISLPQRAAPQKSLPSRRGTWKYCTTFEREAQEFHIFKRLSLFVPDYPLIMKLTSLSMSSFSYAMISSSGISPPEKMLAMDTYWDSLDFRFSLSPSPVTSSTFPLQSSITLKNLSISVMFCT